MSQRKIIQNAFEQLLPAGSKALMLFATLTFFWLYRNGFRGGFLDEDFAWLRWAGSVDWRSAFAPPVGSYFRPLSTNLPYFIFSRLPSGWLFARALALGLSIASAWLISRSGKVRGSALPFLLGALWLFSPFPSFSAFYFNAFDYVLYPFLVLCLLHCLEREHFFSALLFFGCALLSKEQGAAFILAPWLLGKTRKIPWWYWAGNIGGLATTLYFHRGYSFQKGTAGGFVVNLDPASLAVNARALFVTLSTGSGQNNSALIWHFLAWTAVVFLCGARFLENRRNALSCIRTLTFVTLLYLPLIALHGLRATYLGVVFWAVIFRQLGAVGAQLPRKQQNALTFVLLPLSITAGASAFTWVPDQERYYRTKSYLYANLLESSRPFLENCTRADRVVVEDLGEAMGDGFHSSYAYWALQWRFPEPRFYLKLPPSGARPFEIVPDRPDAWVEEWRTKGHPSVKFTRAAGEALQFQVQGKGPPNCGGAVK